MHFHHALFADILRDLAKTAAALPPEDLRHRDSLHDAAKALYIALESNPAEAKRPLPVRHSTRGVATLRGKMQPGCSLPSNEARRESGTYRLAELDPDFLLGNSMRGVRLQLEYEKLEETLRAWGVRATIAVFGGG
jgi:hypothetical protein